MTCERKGASWLICTTDRTMITKLQKCTRFKVRYMAISRYNVILAVKGLLYKNGVRFARRGREK